jgi:hypothetical protein
VELVRRILQTERFSLRNVIEYSDVFLDHALLPEEL